MHANRMDYKGGMTTMPSASVKDRKIPGFSAAAIPEDYQVPHLGCQRCSDSKLLKET